MKTVEIKLYSFSELSDQAKENARNKFREFENQDFDTEFLYDDFVTVGKILGIEIETRSIPLMNGETRKKPIIYFSGFCSQGDGACFEGRYEYSKGWKEKLRAYAPNDAEIMRIGKALQDAQKNCFYSAYATMKHSGHYYHSGCMRVDVDGDTSVEKIEDDIIDEIRSFADWMYSQLEKEHEYNMSDECIEEHIEANKYDFTEKGEIY